MSSEVIDKKARGIDDYDLGEVVELQDNVVVTQKGIVDKDKFYHGYRLPSLVHAKGLSNYI